MRTKKIIPVLAVALMAIMALPSCTTGRSGDSGKANLAVLARGGQVTRGGQREIRELNDGLIPDSVNSDMRRWMNNPNRPQQRQQRLNVMRYEYVWEQPVSIDEVAVFLYDYESFVKLPQAYRFKYWNGEEYVDVANASGMEIENDRFNHTTFTEVSTTRLMLELDSVERFLSPVLEWQVFKPEGAPAVAPVIKAGIDRSVVTGGKTYLSGLIKSVDPLKKTK